MKKLHPFDILLLVILAVIVIALIWEVASGKGSTRTIAKLVTLVVSYALYFLRRFAGNPGTRRQLEEAAAPVVGDTFMRDGKLRRKLLDAWAAYNQNQNAKALKMTDSLESQCISPEETAAVYLLKCCIYEDMGDLPKALNAAETAVWRDPDNPRLHVRLGRIRQAQGDNAGAERAFRDALDRNPEHAAAWSNLAGICLTSSRPEEAAEAAKKSLQYDPALYASMGTLVLAYLMQGDITSSGYWLGQYRQHDPKGAEAMSAYIKKIAEDNT